MSFTFPATDLLILCPLLATAQNTVAAAETKPSVVAVHAARYLDGVSGLVAGSVTVSIVDGRITAVNPGIVEIKDAKVIDLGDVTHVRWVMKNGVVYKRDGIPVPLDDTSETPGLTTIPQ